MSGPRRAAASLGVALLLAAAGCGGSSGDVSPGAGGSSTPTAPATAPADGPTTLQPAARTSPKGTERVVCALHPEDGGPVIRFALDLPDDVRARRTHSRACGWGDPERVPKEHYTTSVQTYVQLLGPNAKSLQDLYDENEPFNVDDGAAEGDDSILHLDLSDPGVKTFGDTLGQRLSYTCFCDGQNLIYRFIDADGVRVTWASVVGLQDQTDAEIETALAGAGIVRR